ncbi:hypothetical protein RHCRD62_10453 [Rhodococcus sp. RD6.2]|nr:hypothetical protein RHCRD62_10453 [Rhodococcus sp. RD6.2]
MPRPSASTGRDVAYGLRTRPSEVRNWPMPRSSEASTDSWPPVSPMTALYTLPAMDGLASFAACRFFSASAITDSALSGIPRAAATLRVEFCHGSPLALVSKWTTGACVFSWSKLDWSSPQKPVETMMSGCSTASFSAIESAPVSMSRVSTLWPPNASFCQGQMPVPPVAARFWASTGKAIGVTPRESRMSASCGDSGTARVGCASTVDSPNLPDTVTGNCPTSALADAPAVVSVLSESEPHAATPTITVAAATAAPIRLVHRVFICSLSCG